MALPGYLALVLHAHLPYVRHPEHAFFLEEDWYYEALTETYIPLLALFHRLIRDGVDFKISLSLTPTLMSMMDDDLLSARYERHLERLTELAEKECVRTRREPALQRLARHYQEQMAQTQAVWQRWDGQLLRGFRELLASEHLEILTCAATHGYLPLLRPNPEAVRAQIAVGVACYTSLLGRAPRGIWLPECGYYRDLDRELAACGLRYFVTDAHGLLLAHPRPRAGTHAPLYCQSTRVAAFGRDAETTHQVWSREQGYPGDPHYREFYRDIGYDLDLDYIAPYVQPDGTRKNTGFKYHRITGPGDQKALYDPAAARARAALHAGNFVFNRERQIEALGRTLGQPPLVMAPYDAELFGHWWYEGPWWLEEVLRRAADARDNFVLTHPVDYLRREPSQQVAAVAESSWGDQGYHEFWLNESNAWIYPHLHKAAARMTEIARRFPQAGGVVLRALNQAARELLLAQSSDWAFIMKSGTMVDYAELRTRSHLRRFTRLYEGVREAAVDEEWLRRVEALDNLFPEIDYHVYC